MSRPPPVPVDPKRVCPLKTRDIVERIILFIEQFTDIKLYTYQALFCRRIVESVIDNDGAIITGLWSRQSGKTETVADVCVGLAIILPKLAEAFPDDPRFMPFVKGFRVGIYAPIDEQARLPYDRIRMRVHSDHGEAFLADPEIDIVITASRGDRLVLSNGSVIISKTASPQAQIEGQTHHLVILEESQKLLRSKVDKEIRPMLASTNGTMVHIGTAWESRGGFHNQIQANIEQHEKGGKRDHFEFPYEIVLEERERAYKKDKNPYHLNYSKFVQKEILRLGGTDNEEFKMNFRCLWQESRVIAVNKYIFEAMADPDLELGPHRGGYQVAGLDIGKVNDPSVLTVMMVDRENPIINPHTLPNADDEKQVYYHKTIFDIYELGGPFEGDAGQYKRLIQRLQMLNVQVLVVDATAIGDPVFERIEAMVGGTIHCVPFKFSSMSKSLLFKYYLQELHARRISYPGGPETRKTPEFSKFRGEHLDLDRIDYGGYAVVSAPEGSHDDYPSSAALACWAEKLMSQVTMPEIEVSSAPVFSRGGRAVSSGRGSSDVGAVVTSSGTPRNRYARRW